MFVASTDHPTELDSSAFELSIGAGFGGPAISDGASASVVAGAAGCRRESTVAPRADGSFEVHVQAEPTKGMPCAGGQGPLNRVGEHLVNILLPNTGPQSLALRATAANAHRSEHLSQPTTTICSRTRGNKRDHAATSVTL